MTTSTHSLPTKAVSGAAEALSSPSPGQHPDERLASLRARAEAVGYKISRCYHADGGAPTFCATRRGLVRELRDIAAVHAFVARIAP